MTGLGTQSVSDEAWRVLLRARGELVSFFSRVSRLPVECIEDCMSEAIVDVVSAFDPIEIATEANRIYVEESTIIAGRLREAMQKRVNAERRHAGKFTSDDTPIGEEDGDLRLRDLFIPRANTAERIENFAEWMMFQRKGGCPLTAEEIRDLFGLYITDVSRETSERP